MIIGRLDGSPGGPAHAWTWHDAASLRSLCGASTALPRAIDPEARQVECIVCIGRINVANLIKAKSTPVQDHQFADITRLARDRNRRGVK